MTPRHKGSVKSVEFLTLTESSASQHKHVSELSAELEKRSVRSVDNWQEADFVHLFEPTLLRREVVSTFPYPKIIRIIRSDTPLVVSTDDLFFIDRPELTGGPIYSLNARVMKSLLRRADGVVGFSRSVKDAFVKELNESKVHVVYPGVGPEYFDGTSSPDGYVLHVSFASKRKNPEAIIEFAKRTEHEFVIAGGYWDQIIPESVQSRENIRVLGYVSEDDLIDLYDGAGVLYFPTLHEGFGIPLVEAMASRTPVVSSHVYSVPEVVGDAGLLFDPGDIERHLKGVDRLIRDEDEHEKLCDRGRERAERFTWAKSAERMEDVYKWVS
jgi:glycosyltransferase involved in cell wall biosynthesis